MKMILSYMCEPFIDYVLSIKWMFKKPKINLFSARMYYFNNTPWLKRMQNNPIALSHYLIKS